MAEKLLNLKLVYKNKYLDTAKEGRDFKTKFYIGKNKHLFWQILNRNFPDRFLFLKKVKNDFRINLKAEMNLVVKQGDQELDKAALRKKKLLKGNTLLLDPGTSGKIDICPEWQIEYFFVTPFKYVPIAEELAVLKDFSQSPPLTREQKQNRRYFLAGLIFLLFMIVLLESLYVPPPKFDLSERLRKLDDNATRIIPEYQEEEVPEIQVQTEEDEGEAQEITKEDEEQAQEVATADFEEMFGVDYNSSQRYEGELFEFDVVSEIVVLNPNVESDRVTRPVTESDRMSVLEQASSKSLDLTTLEDELSDFEEVDLGSEFDLNDLEVATLSSEVENFTVTKVKSKAQFEAVKRKFSTLTTVKESVVELEEIAPETKTEVAAINQVVNAYKPQITKLYIVERMYMDMYGSIEFILYIEEDGSVVAVDVIPAQGSFFTDSFLGKAQEIILKWKIPVTKAVPYSFRMKFIKQ